MSNTQPPSPRRSSGCLGTLVSVLMIGVGLVLLLPGACALVFIIGGQGNYLATLGLLVSWVGLVLIVVGATFEYARNKARDELEAPKGLTAGPRTAAMVVFAILAFVVILGLIGWAPSRNMR